MTSFRALALALCVALVQVIPSGEIDPPGAPDETNSLIDPRTPIPTPGAAVTYPIAITEPGSYRLTRNIEIGTNSTDAIRIQASHVTLDLCGFALRNAGTARTAIVIDPGVRSVVVRNGLIDAWRGRGIDGQQAQSVHMENLTVRNCLFEGVQIGHGAVIDGCTVDGTSSQDGFAVHGSFVARRSQAVNTFYDGFRLATTSEGTTPEEIALIHHCLTRGAGGRGIGAPSSLVHECLIEDSDGAGLFSTYGAFLWGNRIVRSGLDPSSASEDSGIRCLGIGSRIEGNSIVDSNYAIQVTATGLNGGAVFGNTARQTTDPYGQIPAVAQVGPVQSAASTTASPWANFTH